MNPNLTFGLIYGSAREGRMCDTVAGWVEKELSRRSSIAVDVIDPADPDIADGVAGATPSKKAALSNLLDQCDAFIVVTPEYNHSFPAPLKALIDSAKDEWAAKPVAFVSYGGISGGLRAVEHLRHVFAELHAVGIRDGVSFANIFRAFDDDGAPRDKVNPVQALDLMVKRLAWWARALKRARMETSYKEAAA